MANQSVTWSTLLSTLASTAAGVSGIASGTSTGLDGVGSLPAVVVDHIGSIEVTDRPTANRDAMVATISGWLILARTGRESDMRDSASDLVGSLFRAYRTGVKLAQSSVVDDSFLRSAEWVDAIAVGDGSLPGYRLTWWVSVDETFDSPARTA